MPDPHDREMSAAVAAQIARTNDYFARLDGRAPMSGASRRRLARGTTNVVKKATTIGIAVGVLVALTIGFALVVGPIGLNGLFVVSIVTMLAVLVLGLWPSEKPLAPFKEDMPAGAVVQRLGTLLDRRRAALPAPAARRVDAIHQQLPLLESRLADVNALDPLAQDARRLMGKHLPELIERYERVPANLRHERDAEGMTVDDRLVAGLDAAKQALDDLGRKLAHEDLTAFQTQGRFLETRYKDGETGPVG